MEEEGDSSSSNASVMLETAPPSMVPRRVSYIYDPRMFDLDYTRTFIRNLVTHELVNRYNLHPKLTMIRPTIANDDELAKFHSPGYIKSISNLSEFKYNQYVAGASMTAASVLNSNHADIVLNWAGGWHDAKKNSKSGLHYVNDVVLGILELLEVHKRVLYIDIDADHASGVEEAFYNTGRVMTVSFHKSNDILPSTGQINDIGVGDGMYYSLNVPLKAGLNDDNFNCLFRCIIEKVIEVYNPKAIVLQSGAGSLAEKGCFNLSVKGHAACLRYLRGKYIPLMVLGGGGSDVGFVARCWCYETGIAIGGEVANEFPRSFKYNNFQEYLCFGKIHELPLRFRPMEDMNTNEYMESIRVKVMDHLSKLSTLKQCLQPAEVPV